MAFVYALLIKKYKNVQLHNDKITVFQLYLAALLKTIKCKMNTDTDLYC